jgi:biotin carboxyl carrier protein
MKMQLMMEGALRTVVLSEDGTGSGRYCGELDGTPVEMDAALIAPGVVSLILRSGPLAGHAFRFLCTHDASGLNGKTVTAGEQSFACQVHDPRSLNSRKKRAGVGEDTLLIKASMAGRVVRVLVEAGDSVEARDGVVIIEAMKMQNELRAPRAGRIAEIRVSAGEMVGAGQVLAVLE